jgi:protein-S-isoprenylcysteine O-methyltransferase Ste14
MYGHDPECHAPGSAREKYHQQLLGRLCRCLAADCDLHQAHRLPRERRPTFALHAPDRDRLLSTVSRVPSPYPFNVRIIPHTDALLVAAAILCICGVGFCFWARAILGRNWSGSVTLKENHELIVRGPYRLVRHPIYTGLLSMVIATAIQQGHIGGIIGLILISVSLWIKSSHEEEVMRKQFPDQYPAYRERVKRIIPFIL